MAHKTLTNQDRRILFDAVESTLIRVGSQNLHSDKVRAYLDEFKKVEHKTFSDAGYYWVLVYIPFYSGFRSATVTARLDSIRNHLGDYEAVASYGDEEIQEILSDPGMIRNKRKVRACVYNAQTFKTIIHQHGSFQAYIDSFAPTESFDKLMQLRKELIRRFKYLGRITSYHFLTEIGLPVLKPDRVIKRIFYRLGLIQSTGDSEEELLEIVRQGHQFVQTTGHPIRYVDIVFAKYGQVESESFGIKKGVCLKRNPRCSICGVSGYCEYFDQHY